jgi:hypothetical protein
MLRFCVEDLEFALTHLELSGIVSDEHYRERQLVSARKLYERARYVVARLPRASVDKTHIPEMLTGVEEALGRVQP